MHKSERLLVLVLFFLGLLVISCHRSTSNALRIVEINGGDPLIVDIEDVWGYTDEDGDWVDVSGEDAAYDQSAILEVTYTETGTGLPTYPTDYTVQITDYTVTFTDVTPRPAGSTPYTFDPVRGGCNFLITADPEGKKTVKEPLIIVSREWIIRYFSELEDGVTLKAKITLKGKDQISGNDVTGDGYHTIDAANFEDNPKTKGS
jgi:hypothetical protein